MPGTRGPRQRPPPPPASRDVQLDLLNPDPSAVAFDALTSGASLVVSISGGKDSQAMARHLASERLQRGWSGHAEAVHADLGRAEWAQTPAHVERCAAESGLPLVLVRRERGDLVSRIEDRLSTVSTLDPTRPAKPFWPSAAQRYCTSDLKRGPIQKHVRSLGDGAARGEGRGTVVVSAMGMRAAESHARRKRPVLSVDRKVTSTHLRDLSPEAALAAQRASGGRLVLAWLPIHAWSDADVWRELGTSQGDLARRRELYASGAEAEALDGWEAHPAYVLGNERLSCSLCVLGSRSDLANGIRHNPALAARYIALERQTGYTFQDGRSLESIAEEEGLIRYLPVLSPPAHA